MIKILVNDIEANYDESLSIPIKWTNPLLSETGWNEAYSYSFSLPNTPVNLGIFFGSSKKDFEVKIFFQGDFWIRGKLTEPKRSAKRISLNLVEEGTNIRKQLSDNHIDKLNLPSYSIYDDTDSVSVKLEKWREHMYNESVLTPTNEGTHKFPKIKTRGYHTPDDLNRFPNAVFHANGAFVNNWVLGDYVKNPAVESSYTGQLANANQWFLSIAPCPRIAYILEQCLEFFGISLIENDLDSIPEYYQQTHFNNKVLDELVIDGANKYNVHGASFDLNDFLPDVLMISLFENLRECFSVYFIVESDTLRIKRSDTIFTSKSFDASRYSVPDYLEGSHSNIETSISHGFSQEDLLANRIWLYNETGSIPWMNPNPYLSNDIENDSAELVKKPIKFYPMRSFYAYLNGTWVTVNGVLNQMNEDMYGAFEFTSFFFHDELVDSPVFEQDIERLDKWQIGLLRGIHPTRRLMYNPYPTPDNPSEIAIDHLWSYNFDRLRVTINSETIFEPYTTIFGKSSIYINNDNNLVDKYQRTFQEYTMNSFEVSKKMNLPAHILREMRKWKQPFHIIQDREYSFKGLIKEITFNISPTGLSNQNINYLVKRTDD